MVRTLARLDLRRNIRRHAHSIQEVASEDLELLADMLAGL